MKLFSCPNCGNLLYFENVACEVCGARLGYDPLAQRMRAFDAMAFPLAEIGQGRAEHGFKDCANRAHGVCNWLVEDGDEQIFCLSCRHNEVIPNLSQPDAAALWGRMERAKHRLFYTILRLGLPRYTRTEREDGLGFRFLQDNGDEAPVMTGHDNGLITIALAEADDAERERRRTDMGEPYRTLLGHFRHEVGHWYWDRLVRDGNMLEEFRALFGDERADYGEALAIHHNQGPKADWQTHFISAYASAHPWEDFAETFAHYLHVIDTLETGAHWGLDVKPVVGENHELSARIAIDVYDPATPIKDIVKHWLALSAALNTLNRSMGLPDAYPFVLSPEVIEKLGFIHRIAGGNGQTAQ